MLRHSVILKLKPALTEDEQRALPIQPTHSILPLLKIGGFRTWKIFWRLIISQCSKLSSNVGHPDGALLLMRSTYHFSKKVNPKFFSQMKIKWR